MVMGADLADCMEIMRTPKAQTLLRAVLISISREGNHHKNLEILLGRAPLESKSKIALRSSRVTDL